ncbi:hypothetical protein EON79_14370 [bacterium]|nr:MAG: hypothetical protein EON79_14370 [bacterium]
MKDPVNLNFYHVSTGRRVSSSIFDRFVTGGDPIGVWRYQDGYVFQPAIAPVPEVRDLQYQLRPGGKFLVSGKVEPRGIEESLAWMRVRFDGGPWYRVANPVSGTVFGLPDGMHLIDAQGEDSRGRLGTVVARGWVETDRILPSVGPIAIVSYSPGSIHATVRSSGGIRGVLDVRLGGATRVYDNVNPTKTGYVVDIAGLTAGTAYEFRFRIRDDAGNERAGAGW